MRYELQLSALYNAGTDSLLCGGSHFRTPVPLGRDFLSLQSVEPALKYTGLCMPSRFSRVRLFATLWTVARQAPLSMGFSRQEYWSGLPCLPPGDLPNPGMEPLPLTSPALAGRFFTTSTTWEALAESSTRPLLNTFM